MIQVPGSNVAITPIFDPDVSLGGLYIPEMAKDRCDQGIVKYVGPLVKWINCGDYVLFSGYSGTLLSVQDEGKLIIMPESFIIAKLHPANVDIKGLYFKSVDGVYFEATYEMAVELISEAFKESKWFRANKLNKIIARQDKRNTGHADRHLFTGHSEDDLVSDSEVDKELKEETNA